METKALNWFKRTVDRVGAAVLPGQKEKQANLALFSPENLAKLDDVDANSREYLIKIEPRVRAIEAQAEKYRHMSDEELHETTDRLRAKFDDISERSGGEKLRGEIARLEETILQVNGNGARKKIEYDVQKMQQELLKIEKVAMDELLPEAFAAVREAARRRIGLFHFREQLQAGISLYEGKIAEQRTGEGKTLTATLPLFLHAISAHAAHLVTPNDYLSRVGVQWMGPVYDALGMTVGVLQHENSFVYDSEAKSDDDRLHHLRNVPRREAYYADITYGTNHEFGFDYLRDNMVSDKNQMVQHELHFAIVDEVDNILIDEARTPLIISGPSEESDQQKYQSCAVFMRGLARGEEEKGDGDFYVEEKSRNAVLTECGIEKLEMLMRAAGFLKNTQTLHGEEGKEDAAEWLPYLDNALRAEHVYRRDKDYIVKNGQIIIIDEFTGRQMPGRRYSEGLHQALEAKERVMIQREQLTYATISFQNYFRMYAKLAGMTGTAIEDEVEFRKVYGCDVVMIPTHEPMIRKDENDVVYVTVETKMKAVIEEIKRCRATGQPVLVGTASIESSEALGEKLKRAGIPCAVLNAYAQADDYFGGAERRDREAEIIAQAGRIGAVTIATNMAGRGVDILLGGNPEGLARLKLRQQGQSLSEVDDELWQATLTQAKQTCAVEHEQVVKLGGLRIIGTEHHEAGRIDNQLRGRAGRQGDPGSSRFITSLEDELMQRFGGGQVKKFMLWAGAEEESLEHPLLTRTLEGTQKRAEGYNFDIRKHVLEYDEVLNKQRRVIYADRRRAVEAKNLAPLVFNIIEKYAAEVCRGALFKPMETDPHFPFNPQAFFEILRQRIDPNLTPEFVKKWGFEISRLRLPPEPKEVEVLLAGLNNDLMQSIKQRHENISKIPSNLQDLERMTILRAIDTHWVRHLTHMDEFREGIGLRAYGQIDPLNAYRRESFMLFNEMRREIVRDAADGLLKLMSQVEVEIRNRERR